MLQYALKKSFEEMQTVIKLAEKDLNNDNLKKEVNYRVGTFLHWLIDYYEWLEKTYVGSGYTGALKAPVRCFGNHLSGQRKSQFRTDNECGGAAILKDRTSRMVSLIGC